MAGDPTGAPSYSALIGAIDGLRDDFREDLDKVERRLGARISEVRTDVTEFVATHSDAHRAEAERRGGAETRFDDFIRNSELAQAHRDGALGAARFLIEQLSRHAPRLVAILVAVVAGILAASGDLSITIGGPS